MTTFQENLEKYADLAVSIGINVQPDQTLLIDSPISAAEYVRKVVKKAYQAGARHVHVFWTDEDVILTKFMSESKEALSEYPSWRPYFYNQMGEQGAAFLSISASNPLLLKDVDPSKVAAASKAGGAAMEEWRKKYVMPHRNSWSIVAVPTKEWAAQVFPGSSESESINKLWETIFKVTRVDTPDPVQAWKEHVERLKQKEAYLNEIQFRKLHYKAPGTDLTIELPDNHVWITGGDRNEKGTVFMPNIPTEEVFTMPNRNWVNGVVSSTKPLNYSGTLIEDFSLTFQNGRIVDFKADKGYDTLKTLIETDEGSHFLGEVALVPHDSPISNLNLLFFNTLFDENAACHVAIGRAYPTNVKNGSDMSKEEFEQVGGNTSIVHVDFMIGSADLNIDGETKDGKIEPIFRNGNWAI